MTQPSTHTPADTLIFDPLAGIRSTEAAAAFQAEAAALAAAAEPAQTFAPLAGLDAAE